MLTCFLFDSACFRKFGVNLASVKSFQSSSSEHGKVDLLAVELGPFDRQGASGELAQLGLGGHNFEHINSFLHSDRHKLTRTSETEIA